jgi:hypothetical protein
LRHAVRQAQTALCDQDRDARKGWVDVVDGLACAEREQHDPPEPRRREQRVSRPAWPAERGGNAVEHRGDRQQERHGRLAHLLEVELPVFDVLVIHAARDAVDEVATEHLGAEVLVFLPLRDVPRGRDGDEHEKRERRAAEAHPQPYVAPGRQGMHRQQEDDRHADKGLR